MGLILTGMVVIVGVAAILVNRSLATKQASRERVQRVSDEYVRLVSGNLNSGPRGFIQAGAKTLKSDAEVRAVIEQIVARVGPDRHPFGKTHRDRIMQRASLISFIADLDHTASNFSELTGDS